MRIAALDDDPILMELIQASAQHAGHVCHPFHDGAGFLKTLRTETFDLLIVDWHLPDMSGMEVVRTLRAGLAPQMPILFVTRRNAEQDVVEALSCGADDFMTKPIRMAELMARTGALLRRAYPSAAARTLDFGRYRLEPKTRTVHKDGVAIDLKNKEYDLALFMFQNAGRLLSREHMRESVWGDVQDVPSRSLDTHVSRLRSKLALSPENGYVVSAVYGMGYRLDVVSATPPSTGST